ncbi:MAG TPA: RidA family protein [Acidimicrobiales bacterium]|nr:RidA family protein [Acidimicrobiales bacterium]
MERTDVNPWEWSKAFGFSQAVELSGLERVLVCSGQSAVGPDGSPPVSGDMATQIRETLANIVTVLEGGGMAVADVVKTTIYTTDVDAFLAAYGAEVVPVLGSNLPASTLIGVTRLAFPEMLVEIEVTAAR